MCDYGYVRAGELRERANLEDLGLDKGLILKCILKKYAGGLVRVDLAQDRDKWRAVVNAVMNILIP
jgi:hypothetical protein